MLTNVWILGSDGLAEVSLAICREDMDVEDVSERHAQRWAFEAVSDHDLDEAAHYCRYAFAAYGYLLYIWAQPQYKYDTIPPFFVLPPFIRICQVPQHSTFTHARTEFLAKPCICMCMTYQT